MTKCSGPVLKNPPAGGGGNPFGDFYVGVGNVGFVGGPITEPHVDYQSGDTLIALNLSLSLIGYSALSSNPAGFNVFARLASGTSADNIASFQGGLLRQIFAFRNNASFSRAGDSNTQVISFSARTNMPYPANTTILGSDADFILFAGSKFIPSPVSIDDDGNFEKTSERIGGSFLQGIGIAFQGSNPTDILEGDWVYANSASAAVQGTTYRNKVNVL